MNDSVSSALRRLEKVARCYDPADRQAKLQLLRRLARQRLPTAREVARLHEVLCFLCAYPDDRELSELVESALCAFDRRGDLRRHREALAQSGIAGTPIRYRLYWPMARFALRLFPQTLFLEWHDEMAAERMRQALPVLVTRGEAESVRASRLPTRRLLQRSTAKGESDAAFFIGSIESMPGDDRTREALHDGIDAEYRIDPGPPGSGGPSRTRARRTASPVVFRSAPPARARPDLRVEPRRAPRSIRPVSPREGRKLVDLACEAMLTRSRDLEAFGFGDPRDVRIVDDGAGLEFVCIGVRPERRKLLHATYGYLTLQSGVPIGYVQVDPLLGSAGVSYNTFETFRGAEAAWVFGRMLAATRHLFDVRSFSIEPYQLGLGNEEGLASGAWWFYYKLGFRPRDREVRKLVRREEGRLGRDRRYRSSRATLERLASAHLYFGARKTQSPPPPPWSVGDQIAAVLAGRGADRDAALGASVREAASALDIRSFSGWSRDERRAFQDWAPLVLALPGLRRWSAADRRALVRVVRSKAGRSEAEFVRRFDTHPHAGRAILSLHR